MIKNIEDYPIILNANHLHEILNVSKPKVYDIMDMPDFPLIRLGRTKRVIKEDFFKWLSSQCNTSL